MNSTKKDIEHFRKIFWDAFHIPDLSTEKLKQAWQHLEDLNNQIAGPMFSVFENENCDYIFREERLPGIKNPDDLFDRQTEQIKEYANFIANQHNPQNPEEEKDLQLLLYQADQKMELAELMLKILKRPSHSNSQD